MYVQRVCEQGWGRGGSRTSLAAPEQSAEAGVGVVALEGTKHRALWEEGCGEKGCLAVVGDHLEQQIKGLGYC